ncbi:decarboxylating NADP(+)-dependent phosphogluconate dehydrogenase [Aliiglaciecola sp. 3_MG-2023]|uniref:decarboxylating NADP(+)-dependent phosphogluconate dehydrogenase n=1 Tax=Aliiglaciecola sp. 3_MG-2023 TaxID=3062644 RepID=UPI0026E4394C|nr:decarboxylating NADP(+)-dependent phosphogluconate dehydrogenase [Aliiglaciecola sp. 3_MG-2023]MDO6693793.1 decarboxylating NADP(+)-dependent phosphogluconate dehydrogenase [Aliiglaciecola sp. 3_MG-2023]
MKALSDIAVVGLAVMGENLILNMASKGFTVTAYNRSYSKVENFLGTRAKDKTIRGADSIESLVASLSSPRKIMLMVKSGQPVDDFIEQLIPHLDQGDIIIDGGNSQFEDSNRRTAMLTEKGLLYVGTGVSGGEEGALLGPSIMPGGNPQAWPHVKPIFQAISAKVKDENGELSIPCCDWVGEGGAGHFVKMVHNGIEYGDMQIICEGFILMQDLLGMSTDEMQAVFKQWNETELSSYLTEITADILGYKENGEALVNSILDTAGQKGTGKWTGITALHLGVPLTLIGEAVFARCLSAIKEQRVQAAKTISGPKVEFTGDKVAFLESLRQALLASKIVSYAQGFAVLQEAAKEYKWNLDYGSIAMMWREGCIIRSVFLDNIKAAYDNNPDLDNLLLDDYFNQVVAKAQQGWREVVATAAMQGVAVPCLSSALSYFDGYRTENLPANLLQAQRDYFGAHTYERKDKPRGEFFHTNWTGRGGDTASTTYDV